MFESGKRKPTFEVEHYWRCVECRFSNEQFTRKNEGAPCCERCGVVKPNENKRNKKVDLDYNEKFITCSGNNEFGVNGNSTPDNKLFKSNARSIIINGERYSIKRVQLFKTLDITKDSNNPKIIMKLGIEKILEVVGQELVSGKIVLDIGCGRGELLKRFLDERFQISGIEKDERTFFNIEEKVKKFCFLVDAVEETSWLEKIEKSSIIIFSNLCFPLSVRNIIENNILTLAKKGSFIITTFDGSFDFAKDCVKLVTIKQKEGEENICQWDNGSIFCFRVISPLSVNGKKVLQFPSK